MPLLPAVSRYQTRHIGLGNAKRLGAVRSVAKRSAPALFFSVTLNRVAQHLECRTVFFLYPLPQGEGEENRGSRKNALTIWAHNPILPPA